MAPMPRLSVVIPCLSGAEFEDTLVSVLQHRPARCQIIVASAEEYNDPYDLGGEVDFVSCPQAAQQTELINAALEIARAPIVNLLSCRVEVTEGWERSAIADFADPQRAAVAPALVSKDQPDRIVALGVAYSPLLGSRTLIGAGGTASSLLAKPPTITGPTLEAGFYRRELLEQVGGAPEGVGDELADLDLALLLADLGLTCSVQPQSRVLCNLAKPAPVDSPFQQARNRQRLFRRHAALHPSSLSGVLRPVAAVFDAAARLPGLAAFTTLAGRIVGRLESGVEAAYEAQLRAAKEALQADSAEDDHIHQRPAATVAFSSPRNPPRSSDGDASSQRRAA
jgi:hypothetical protein